MEIEQHNIVFPDEGDDLIVYEPLSMEDHIEGKELIKKFGTETL